MMLKLNQPKGDADKKLDLERLIYVFIETKKKAIMLYVKYGLKAASVIRDPEYPDRYSLKKRCEDYISNNNKVIIQYGRKNKYSNQQRKQAIHFYLTHGKNISYTVRTVEYSCRSVLSNRICKDIKKHHPSILKDRNQAQYSQEDKQIAALEVAIRDESVKKISKKTRANSTTLYNWNKKYVSDELNAQIQKDKLKPDAEIASLKEEIQKLQKDIYQLRMEKEILEKAAELLKKDEGIDINDLTNKEKTIVINALRDHYQLKVLLKSLKMAKSSYFYQLSAISKNKYERIKGRISKIFNCSYQSYGYRRIKKSLENEGTKISEKVVRRLMKEERLFARGAQKRRYSSYLGEISPAVPNIINRDFSSESPNKKLLTDITEFHIKNDKVYLSPMIDCFDGYVLSWTIGLSPNAELVNTMLKETINKLDIEEKPIIHSDRGAHYG